MLRGGGCQQKEVQNHKNPKDLLFFVFLNPVCEEHRDGRGETILGDRVGLSLTSPGSRVAVQPRPPRSRQRVSGNCSPLETRFPSRRFRKSSVPVAERAGRAPTAVAKSFVPGALLPLRAQRGQSPSVARAGDPRGLSTAVIAAAGAPRLVLPALLGGDPRQLQLPCGPCRVGAATAEAVQCWARPGAREGKAEAARRVGDRADSASRLGCPQHPRLPSAADPAAPGAP